jgi:hypothetical protein
MAYLAFMGDNRWPRCELRLVTQELIFPIPDFEEVGG